MSGDSDESEYVKEEESQSSDQETGVRKRKSTDHGFGQPKQLREAPAISELPVRSASGSRKRDRKVPIHVLRAYRDLLNTTISELHEPGENSANDSFPASQIGSSIWTPDEKANFFAKLPSCGSGNLLALSTAVGTKSQPEIKAYIQLLQEGVRELDTTAKPSSKFGLADVPAAAEISAECLEWEETLAQTLESKARKKEEDHERERWGEDDWLIDEDVAEAIEDDFSESKRSEMKREIQDEPMLDANADRKNSDEASEAGSDDAHLHEAVLSPDSLFKPLTFLELSRMLFMNSNNPDLNWQHLTESGETGPSMRQTAMQDFYNLTVSLTRRAIQASIFQALSRLRASSDSRLLPAVNGHDVRAACDIVGLTKRPSYWADAVRRCGIEVYSDAKKLRGQEGRQGTKQGFKLSRAELQAELGLSNSDHIVRSGDESSIDVEDTSDEEPDSDAYTETSSSEVSAEEESDSESKEAVKQRGRTKYRPSERKQPLSPSSFDRAERKYLDSLDRINSTVEENQLRDVLGMETLPKSSLSTPTFPFKRLHDETSTLDWRDFTQYEEAWEQPHGMPRLHEFQQMSSEGERRRKRRRGNAEEGATKPQEHEVPHNRAGTSHSDDSIDENEEMSESGSSSEQEEQHDSGDDQQDESDE